ncbi:hypothetical protein [Streptomyces sp. SudanB52_2052]|uniref:hypothetical protein n=1 Tax=Streptomyces sp. SudanB52_2052 TaxID=3035276 RepID=UPI003F56CB79
MGAAFAQRGGAVVAAQQEGVGVVVEDGSVAGEELAGEGGGDGGAFEAVGGRGLAQGVAGGRSGDAFAVGVALVEVGGGLGRGEGGLDVDEVVDAAAGAGGVAAGGGGVEGEWGAQVAVLDGEGDQASGLAGDVPGEGTPQAGAGDGAVRVGRDGFVGCAPGGGLVVDPGEEVGDALVEADGAQDAVAAGVGVVVGGKSARPGGVRRSRTRMAVTAGAMATQGTGRGMPAEGWLPSGSRADLKCRALMRFQEGGWSAVPGWGSDSTRSSGREIPRGACRSGRR